MVFAVFVREFVLELYSGVVGLVVLRFICAVILRSGYTYLSFWEGFRGFVLGLGLGVAYVLSWGYFFLFFFFRWGETRSGVLFGIECMD